MAKFQPLTTAEEDEETRRLQEAVDRLQTERDEALRRLDEAEEAVRVHRQQVETAVLERAVLVDFDYRWYARGDISRATAYVVKATQTSLWLGECFDGDPFRVQQRRGWRRGDWQGKYKTTGIAWVDADKAEAARDEWLRRQAVGRG